MRKQIVCAVVAMSPIMGAIMGAATGALAQSQQEQQACTHDAFQFCGDVIPDRDRVFNCLVAKKDVISAACHTVMAPYLPADAPPVQKAAVHTQSAKGAKGAKGGKGAKGVQTGKSTSIKSAKLAKNTKTIKTIKSTKSTKTAKNAKSAKSKGPLDLRPH